MKRNSLRMDLMMALLVLCLGVTGTAQNLQDPGVMLRAAIEKEEVEGDLRGAIELYQDIFGVANSYPLVLTPEQKNNWFFLL